MDAVKLKMDNLVKDKIALIKVAADYESEITNLEEKCASQEKSIRTLEKSIANCEDSLDKTLTEYIDAQEKLDAANATATTAELEVNALTRKITLIQEESQRVEERYKETIAKLS